MPQHALQPHVVAFARRLDLSGVVIDRHAVRRLRDRDERVQPFADVGDVRQTDPRRRLAAEGDEPPGTGGVKRTRGRAATTDRRRRP